MGEYADEDLDHSYSQLVEEDLENVMTQPNVPRVVMATNRSYGKFSEQVIQVLKQLGLNNKIEVMPCEEMRELKITNDQLVKENEELKKPRPFFDGLKVSGKERRDFETEKNLIKEQLESANKLARENSIRAHDAEKDRDALLADAIRLIAIMNNHCTCMFSSDMTVDLECACCKAVDTFTEKWGKG